MDPITAVFALAMAAISTAGVSAGQQTAIEGDVKTVEVKGGKALTMTGCLERNPGGGFMLTGRDGGMLYALVTDKDLTKQVGQFVSVSGKATDRGDAKLKIESKTTSGGITSKVKTEHDGALGLHYFGVDSVDTIAPACR